MALLTMRVYVLFQVDGVKEDNCRAELGSLGRGIDGRGEAESEKGEGPEGRRLLKVGAIPFFLS